MKTKDTFNLRNFLKTGVTLATMGFVYLAAETLPAELNRAYYSIWPTPIRQEFNKKFGFPIEGYSSDIESRQDNISTISEIITREQIEKPFELGRLQIESTNMFLRSHDAKMADMHLQNGAAGNYKYEDISVHINNSALGNDVLSHEIKHVKKYEIKDVAFIAQWANLAVDSTGKSIYYDDLGIKGMVVEGDFSSVHVTPENERLGFISDYARRNIDEDIAEISGKGESKLDNLDYLKSLNNPIIRKKTALAIKYELLPAEFFEYVALLNKNNDLVHGTKKDEKTNKEELYRVEIKDAHDYLSASREFLHRHPNSIYAMNLRFDRANITVLLGNTYGSNWNREAIAELETGITAEFKPTTVYRRCLQKLSQLYSDNGDEQNYAKYAFASAELMDEVSKGNMYLSTTGMSDYLQKISKHKFIVHKNAKNPFTGKLDAISISIDSSTTQEKPK